MSETHQGGRSGRTGIAQSRLLRRIPVIVLLTLAVIGVGMTLYASHWGPWAFSDGVGYLVTARNLAEGKGLGIYRPAGAFVPTVTHPPLFPYLLALLTGVAGDVLQASRWLNALLISLLVIAVPLLFRRIVGLTSLAAILGLLLITHPGIILMFVSAMSEPLFVVTGTGSLLVLCLYISNPKRPLLAVALVLAAAAMLTRYVGLAYVAAGAVTLLLLDERGSKRRRLFRAAAYSGAAILPTLTFLGYWAQTPHARTVRRFALPPSLGDSLSLFVGRVVQALWSWKPLPTAAVLNELARSPGELIALGIVLLTLLLAAIASLRWIDSEVATGRFDRRPTGDSDPWLLIKIFSLFVATFLGGMLLAFAFSSPTPDIDSRTLFPVLPSLLLIGLSAFAVLLLGRPHSRTIQWAAAGAMLIFSAGSAPATLDIVTGIHRTGLGFTAREWHESETMEYVQSLDQQAVLISNAPESIMLFSGRSAYPVPSLPTGDARAPEPAGRDSASALDTLVCGDGALLVVFDRSLDGTDPRFDATLALESFSCDVASIFRGTDGVVYSNQLAP